MTDHGGLIPFADGVWTASTPIRFAGTWMPHVMTAVRLSDDGVLLHSPCRPSRELREAIAAIGPVTDVVAPNWFHDLYLDDYRAAYPAATFWGPAFLKRQHPALIDCLLDGGTRARWVAELPHVTVHGLLTFDESVFCHAPTQTLVVADLLMNAAAGDDAPPLTRLGFRLLRLDGSLKVFPVLRWFGGGRAVRDAARTMLQWNPQRLIVGHGTPSDHDVPAQLRNAFSYLRL